MLVTKINAIVFYSSQIGVLVGRAATGKDFVLQLVTCPGQEGSAPITAKESTAQKAGGVKGKAQQAAALTLDADWIVEHAAQVSRLLPGGERENASIHNAYSSNHAIHALF